MASINRMPMGFIKKYSSRLVAICVITVIYFLACFGSTQRLPTLQALKRYDSLTMMNDSVIRCRSKLLGCFVPLEKPIAKYQKFQMLNNSRIEMKRKCLHWCYSSGGNYAGLAVYSQECLCSSGMGGFISHENSRQWAEMRWYLAENCENPASYEIFRKIENCGGNTTKSAAQDLIGWTRLPFGEKSERMLQLQSAKVTINQCVLNCEVKGYMIAVPYLNHHGCLCTDYESLFTKTGLAMLGSRQPSSAMYNTPIYRTLNEDPACVVRFGSLTTGSPIALTSDPGSGNTWIRHLLETSMGVYTESVYTDRNLYNGGFLGEFTKKKLTKAVAVKDHLLGMKIRPQFGAAILLIRNPHDSLIAEWARLKSNSHTGVPAAKVFADKSFTDYANKAAVNWMKRILMVLSHKWKLMLIYYEDLRESPVREMRRVAEFLNLNSTDHEKNFEKRLICMQIDLTGGFKRPPRKLDFNPFTESPEKALHESIVRVNETLKEHHFPPLPTSYLTRS